MTSHPMYQDGAYSLFPATKLGTGIVYVEMGSPRPKDYGDRAVAEALVKRCEDKGISRLERDQALSRIGFYMTPLGGLRAHRFDDGG